MLNGLYFLSFMYFYFKKTIYSIIVLNIKNKNVIYKINHKKLWEKE